MPTGDDHCAYTLDPGDYWFGFEGDYADLLEPADPDGDDDQQVWRCRRKTNPDADYCPFHHPRDNDRAVEEDTLARAFLAVVRDNVHEGSWVDEELNERDEGCVLDIVPRADDPPDGAKRRRKQFFEADFGELSLPTATH